MSVWLPSISRHFLKSKVFGYGLDVGNMLTEASSTPVIIGKLSTLCRRNFSSNPRSLASTRSKIVRPETDDRTHQSARTTGVGRDRASVADRIKFEYEMWKHADPSMPEHVLETHWEILAQLRTSDERLRYLSLLGSKQRAKDLLNREKAERRREFLSERAEILRRRTEADHLFYGMGGNFLFLRLEKQVLHKWAQARLAIAYQATKLTVVHDFSLMKHMVPQDQFRSAAAAQTTYLSNLEHRQPSNLIFSGMDRQSFWYKKLINQRFLPTGVEDYPLIDCTEKHYTDLYPVDRLVYLTSDATRMLNTVDEDLVYIIGNVADKSKMLPMLTIGEAKKRGIATARLPIDRYITWGKGTKCLCSHAVHRILLDYYMTGDWHHAFVNNLSDWNLESAEPLTPEKRLRRAEEIENRQSRTKFLLGLVAGYSK